MWNHNPLLDRLGISVPLIQAPMAGASNPDLVAAVSNAGGMGSLGAAALPPEVLRTQVQRIQEKTNLPFCVNLFAPETEYFPGGVDVPPELARQLRAYHKEFGLGDVPEPKGLFGPALDQLDVLIEAKVPVISFHFGIAPEQVEQIHRAGLLTLSSATSPSEAVLLEQAGVDVVIAQGAEAGGHRGSFAHGYERGLIGTLALVPQVVDAVKVPVIAAGGIMDARGIVAAAALGASAIQMGTAFLGCPETNLNPAWLDQLQKAAPEDTIVTRVISGKPARGLRNRYIEALEALGEEPIAYPLQYSLSRKLRAHAHQTNNPDFMALWSGQGVTMIREEPAAELVTRLNKEAKTLASNLYT